MAVSPAGKSLNNSNFTNHIPVPYAPGHKDVDCVHSPEYPPGILSSSVQEDLVTSQKYRMG